MDTITNDLVTLKTTAEHLIASVFYNNDTPAQAVFDALPQEQRVQLVLALRLAEETGLCSIGVPVRVEYSGDGVVVTVTAVPAGQSVEGVFVNVG